MTYLLFKLQVVQKECFSKKTNKKFLCIERVSIKADVEVVFHWKLKQTKSGEDVMRPYIDNSPWKKKNLAENVGTIEMAQENGKKTTVVKPYAGNGFSISVLKFSGFFKLELEIEQSSGSVTGLCKGTIASLEPASPNLSITHVSFILMFQSVDQVISAGSRGGSGFARTPSLPPVFKYPMKMK